VAGDTFVGHVTNYTFLSLPSCSIRRH